jgi:glycosyltransferase involved in cell wall biosynthesis
VTSVFYAFRDSALRRRALSSERGSPERYVLFGLDELRARGFTVDHNLEREESPPGWARLAGAALKRGLEWAGGYGGDFATVLASLRRANRADIVFSTVDTVGIPLLLLNRAGLVRRPVVYIAIGLPERLEQLRSRWMRKLYATSLGRVAAVVTYSEHEADVLRAWVERHGGEARVEFVPFGVDVDRFRPADSPGEEVVSIGADPQRDFELLLRVAARMPETSFRIVTTEERLRALPAAPSNVRLDSDLPFDAMRERLSGARVVALPVRENSYSGATTVLLQAMGSGKPVVVTRTQAIATGYGLVDGDNCRLVPPGDAEAFERALGEVLRDDAHARALGASARATVERELGWQRYVDRIERLLRDAAALPDRARSDSS